MDSDWIQLGFRFWSREYMVCSSGSEYCTREYMVCSSGSEYCTREYMVFPLASKHLEKSVVECNGFFSHVQIPSDLHGLLVGNHVKSECLI